jgi:hypothetical protein
LGLFRQLYAEQCPDWGYTTLVGAGSPITYVFPHLHSHGVKVTGRNDVNVLVQGIALSLKSALSDEFKFPLPRTVIWHFATHYNHLKGNWHT